MKIVFVLAKLILEGRRGFLWHWANIFLFPPIFIEMKLS